MIIPENFQLTNIKKGIFGYNKKQIEEHMKFLELEFEKIQKENSKIKDENINLVDKAYKKENITKEYEEKIDELYKQIDELEDEVKTLRDKLNMIEVYKEEPIEESISNITYEDAIHLKETKSVLKLKGHKAVASETSDDEDVFVGEVEEKTNNNFLIGDGEEPDEDFTFIG